MSAIIARDSADDAAMKTQELLCLRHTLRHLSVTPIPMRLQDQLRVLASREQARRVRTLTFADRLNDWRCNARLFVDNLMRPMALPFAGGVLSAFFLFAMLMPSLGFLHNFRDDVPLERLSTGASVGDVSPFSVTKDDIVVELTIDENGQAVDYSFPGGQLSREAMNNIGNLMLFTSFNPATLFGQPTVGKIRVPIRRVSRIVVKG